MTEDEVGETRKLTFLLGDVGDSFRLVVCIRFPSFPWLHL